MSRRIVQLAVASSPVAGDRVFAVDNNGIAWRLEDSGMDHAKWVRLPELPSVKGLGEAARGAE